VGAFDHTILALSRLGFSAALRDRVEDGAALLGICVGMQILAAGSDEGDLPGLGLIPGYVRMFNPAEIACRSKVPHMGWNSITKVGEHALLRDIDCEGGFYFLHSYHYVTEKTEYVLATTEHGNQFPSIVGNGRVFGIQFHPEKSHRNGAKIIKNFSEI